MTLLTVDLLEFCVCCVRSGVTRCIPLMMLYLDSMCQFGLPAVPYSHICILMRRLVAEPRCTIGLLFPSQCTSGTIFYLMVSNYHPYAMVTSVFRWFRTGGFQGQGQNCFIDLSCYISTKVFYYFSLSLLSVYWLVLWGWYLRTDRVYITHSLSALHCLPLLIIIIIESNYSIWLTAPI